MGALAEIGVYFERCSLQVGVYKYYFFLDPITPNIVLIHLHHWELPFAHHPSLLIFPPPIIINFKCLPIPSRIYYIALIYLRFEESSEGYVALDIFQGIHPLHGFLQSAMQVNNTPSNGIVGHLGNKV